MSHQAVADSEQAVTYPADAGADTFLLAVRGIPSAASFDEARKIHNATAGAAPEHRRELARWAI